MKKNTKIQHNRLNGHKIGKIILLLLCFCFILTLPNVNILANSALPDESEKGSITIYKYKVSSDAPEGPGGTGAAGQTLPEGAKPLQGIAFEVVRVQDDTTTVLGADPIVGDGEYADTLITDDEGMAVFDDLAQGVYLVTEQDSPAVSKVVPPFLVRIPMTNPTGTGWLYDIYVYPKNVISEENVYIYKYVKEVGQTSSSEKRGDEIPWYIVTSIPEDMEAAKQFDIIDNLDSNMDYVSENPVIYILGKDGSRTLMSGENNTNYTVEFDNNKMTIALTAAGRTLAAQALAGEGDNDPELEIQITTELNSNSQNSLGQNISNGASLYYRNSVETIYNPDVDEEPYVVTGGVSILKIGETQEVLLAGAKFKIYPRQEDAVNGQNAITNPDNNGEEWEITTDINGKAGFLGLPYGNYWIVETVAPKYNENRYYNLLDEPEQVTIDGTTPSPQITIQNNIDGPGFVLPATGGSGTFWFTLIGVLFIIGAIFIFNAARKRRDNGSAE